MVQNKIDLEKQVLMLSNLLEKGAVSLKFVPLFLKEYQKGPDHSTHKLLQRLVFALDASLNKWELQRLQQQLKQIDLLIALKRKSDQ